MEVVANLLQGVIQKQGLLDIEIKNGRNRVVKLDIELSLWGYYHKIIEIPYILHKRKNYSWERKDEKAT